MDGGQNAPVSKPGGIGRHMSLAAKGRCVQAAYRTRFFLRNAPITTHSPTRRQITTTSTLQTNGKNDEGRLDWSADWATPDAEVEGKDAEDLGRERTVRSKGDGHGDRGALGAEVEGREVNTVPRERSARDKAMGAYWDRVQAQVRGPKKPRKQKTNDHSSVRKSVYRPALGAEAGGTGSSTSQREEATFSERFRDHEFIGVRTFRRVGIDVSPRNRIKRIPGLTTKPGARGIHHSAIRNSALEDSPHWAALSAEGGGSAKPGQKKRSARAASSDDRADGWNEQGQNHGARKKSASSPALGADSTGSRRSRRDEIARVKDDASVLGNSAEWSAFSDEDPGPDSSTDQPTTRSKANPATSQNWNESRNENDEVYRTSEQSSDSVGIINENNEPMVNYFEVKSPKPKKPLPFSHFITRLDSPADSQSATSRPLNEATDASEDLPLPPFMRKKNRQSTRFDKWYKTSTFERDMFTTQKSKEETAPFATAFAQNPWAQMLATPMRQDCYTGARLPKACMIDFHLAEDAENDKTKMLPLGLAAELLPRKQKFSAQERDIMRADREAQMVKPQGVASHVIVKKEGLDYISGQPKARLRRRAVGIRMQRVLEKDQLGGRLEWRDDMGDVVLMTLRRIVKSKLRGYMLEKTEPVAEGMIPALNKKDDMRMLDDFEDVGCVVRLKPLGPDEEPLKRVPEPKNAQRSHFWPCMTSFLGDTYGEWDHDSPAQRWAREEAARSDQVDSKALKKDEGIQNSLTKQVILDHWSPEDKLGSPFLGHCLPLHPPTCQSTWYYPTVRYRTQRVPIYNLPHLLGDEQMEELLHGTAFNDTNALAVCRPWETNWLQKWLWTLQMFMATPKAETPRT